MMCLLKNYLFFSQTSEGHYKSDMSFKQLLNYIYERTEFPP